MGAPRYARPGDRLRTPLERADRDRGADVHSLAGPGLQQVLRLASALRPGERTQRLDPARLLAGREGEASHPRLPRPLPAGRLSAADLHDAGRRRGGGESLERLASASSGGPPGALERQAVEQGEGLPAAPGAARALARGYLLPQSGGHLLLPLQRVGRLQPLLGALGDSRSDDRSRSRDHFAAGAGAVSSALAPHHLGQRAAVHRPRLQGIHPPLRYDSRPDLAVLSAVERQDRTLAPIVERRVCPPGGAAVDRRRAPLGGSLRGPLQSGPVAQRHRLRYALGQARRARAANLCRARSQAGSGAAPAPASPSGGSGPAAGTLWRVLDGSAKLMRPGETEAGSAGTQPCRGITRWKLIEEDERGTASTAVLPFFLDFDRFPHALKIPAAKRRNTSYRKTATLHFTLNQDRASLRRLRRQPLWVEISGRIDLRRAKVRLADGRPSLRSLGRWHATGGAARPAPGETSHPQEAKSERAQRSAGLSLVHLRVCYG